MPDTCTASELNDPLPEEGSPQAMTDDALVDTFLTLLHKRRDLVERQLKAPTFVPATTLMTGNLHDGVTFASATSSDSYASSVGACSAIFASQQTSAVQLQTTQRMRDEQERDVSLQKWIKHHTTSSSKFAPQLT